MKKSEKHISITYLVAVLSASFVVYASAIAQEASPVVLVGDNKPEEQKKDENQAASKPDKPANKYQTIFFSDDEIEAIINARAAFKTGDKQVINEDDFLSKLDNITKEKKTGDATPIFTYPQFFLASIAYYSADDWVVWVNDEKITPDSDVSKAGLRVIRIDKDSVTIEWHPTVMDKIVDVMENAASGVVKVDMLNKNVMFTLKPNQTFTSYAMQVVEGKVPPVVLNPKEEEKK